MGEYDFDPIPPTFETSERNDKHSVAEHGREWIRILTVALLSVALMLSTAIPWLVVRLPGLGVERYSLLSVTGGTLLVTLVGVLVLGGLGALFVRVSLGLVILGIGVALLGWFAGLVTVVVGVLRGLLPAVNVLGFDATDGLIGQGPGVVLTLGASILISAEVLRGLRVSADNGGTSSTSRVNAVGLAALLIVVGLSAANHSKWAIVRSGAISGELAIPGDSLFGSVVIGVATWSVGMLAVGLIAGVPRVSERVISVVLAVASTLKIIQLVVLWVAAKTATWLLPDSVENIAAIRLEPAFWVSLVLALLGLIGGTVGAVTGARLTGLGWSGPIRIAPAAVLSVAALFMVVAGDPNPSIVVAEETLGSSTTVVAEGSTTTSSTSIPSDSSTASAVDFVSSTVFVVLGDGRSTCASGSGVFVGDGTRVLTNAHVVVPGDLDPRCSVVEIAVALDASSEPSEFYEATIERIDEDLDAAVLRVAGLRAGQYSAPEVRYPDLPIGSEIQVVGYPGIGGNTVTLTRGVISGFTKDYGSLFYKVSAAINAGNSGGPMFDADGKLAGIATAVVRAEISCTRGGDCLTDGTNLGLVRPMSQIRSLLGD